MIRALLPPIALLGLALASALAVPLPTRAADAPLLATVTLGVEIDPVDKILRSFAPTAVFTGRFRSGIGYVLVSGKHALLVRPLPNGAVRIEPAEPAAVKRMAMTNGWLI